MTPFIDNKLMFKSTDKIKPRNGPPEITFISFQFFVSQTSSGSGAWTSKMAAFSTSMAAMSRRNRSDVLHVAGVAQTESVAFLSQRRTLHVSTSRVSSSFAEAN